MRGVFLFLMRPSGGPVTSEVLERFDAVARRNELPALVWSLEDNYAAALGDVAELGRDSGPQIVRTNHLVTIGSARLDNRDVVTRWTDAPERLVNTSDLGVVAAAVDRQGVQCIAQILGDFAFIAWNTFTRELIGARDAFGGRALFHRSCPDLIALSSRAALLAEGDKYDLNAIADYLVGGLDPTEPTIFAGVSSLGSGSVLSRAGNSLRQSRYWSPHDFLVDPTVRGEEAYSRLRELLVKAVQLRVTGNGETWAQLSGGLDSSSIVAIAQSLAETGGTNSTLGGTVTFVDTLGAGDEREYVAALTNRYPVRNEAIIDMMPWADDGMDPPLTDKPAPQYIAYARIRRMCETVRAGGGRILLSGYGSDHYLSGNLYFFADGIAKGRVRDSVREMVRWAALGRTSLWQLARESVAFPMAPAAARHWLLDPRQRVPSWIEPRFVRRYRMRTRSLSIQSANGLLGNKYAGMVAACIAEFGVSVDRNYLSEHLEMRYPFLYRPLVEFALRLPPEERTRPYARKWALREALHGILPEKIRTRPGKGGIGDRTAWSFAHYRRHMLSLVQDSILVELGCLDRKKLTAAVVAASCTGAASQSRLLLTLSLEMWLRVRSGRWAAPEWSREARRFM